MELELVEDLVDLLGVTGDAEACDDQVIGTHGGYRCPVLDVVASREEVVGVHAHRQAATARSVERSTDSVSIALVDQTRRGRSSGVGHVEAASPRGDVDDT